MLRKLYKTNEFALLCGTTKYTLFHYDKIGLLSPAVREENGYRYYTAEQFDIFNIINIMKKLGIPLEKIKEYLSIRNKQGFIKILQEKQKKLVEEIENLQNMNLLLTENISLLKEDLTVKTEKILIEKCNEEYLIVTPTAKVSVPDEKIILDTLSQHFRYCKENRLNVGIHVGEVVLKEDIFNEKFNVSYCYSKIKTKVNNTRLFIKPKGLYAILYYQGNYENLSKVYKDFYYKIKKMDYKIVGNFYAEDVVDYFSESDPEKFILKISLQISQ